MRKILSFKKLEDRIYLLEYEVDYIFFKKIYERKVFRGITYWRWLDTGKSLPIDLDLKLSKYSLILELDELEKQIKKI